MDGPSSQAEAPGHRHPRPLCDIHSDDVWIFDQVRKCETLYKKWEMQNFIYRATGLDVVFLKEEMGSRGKMGFLARLA